MNAPLAWVTGAGGLIGAELVRSAPAWAPGWQVRGLTRERLELTDFSAVRRMFETDHPRVVIHCAAMTRTPECEVHPQLAHRINVDVAAWLAELASASQLVLFSTDLVFDGKRSHYREDDAVNPLGVYGVTKAAAEKIVLANPQHLVIRTSLNYGTSPTCDRSFNEQMAAAWRVGKTLRLFIDEFRSPVSVRATARATWELVRREAAGLFHVAGPERLSRFQLGELVAQRVPQLNPKLEAASIREHVGPPRPRDVSLNCGKAQTLLSFALPSLRDELA